MSDSFDVLDSWGNVVGKFTPSDSGSGCLFSVIVMLVMAILWTVGFLFYCVYWLAAKGVAAAKEGKWFEASVCWVIPAALVVASMVLVVRLVAAEQFKNNLPHLVQVVNARAVRCRDNDCPCLPEGDNQIYVLFTVANLSSVPFKLNARLTTPEWTYSPWADYGLIGAGQTSLFCIGDKMGPKLDSNNKLTFAEDDCVLDVMFRRADKPRYYEMPDYAKDKIVISTILRELSPQ